MNKAPNSIRVRIVIECVILFIAIIVLGIILCFVYLPRTMTPRRFDSLFNFIFPPSPSF
jgi:ABC-type antimicrobial peptide transport system permease subunit